LQIARLPDSYFDKIGALWSARRDASLSELAVAIATLALLLYWPRLKRAVRRLSWRSSSSRSP